MTFIGDPYIFRFSFFCKLAASPDPDPRITSILLLVFIDHIKIYYRNKNIIHINKNGPSKIQNTKIINSNLVKSVIIQYKNKQIKYKDLKTYLE